MRTVTREQAHQIAMAKKAANVQPGVRKQIQREAIASQLVDLSKYYYSRIRFEANSLAAGLLTFLPEERYAFGYELRQDVDGHAGHAATYADTNILEARSTNSGETAHIVGMAIRPTPTSDAVLMNLMDQIMSVSLRLDNREVFWLGNPSDIPGSSQLAKGQSFAIPTDMGSEVAPIWTPTQKGENLWSDYLPFPTPIIWRPGDRADSKLDVAFRLYETFTHDVGVARAQDNDPATAASFQSSYTPPAALGDPGTYVDFMCKLYVQTEGGRSVNT
mgnify:CR=1 FL=1